METGEIGLTLSVAIGPAIKQGLLAVILADARLLAAAGAQLVRRAHVVHDHLARQRRTAGVPGFVAGRRVRGGLFRPGMFQRRGRRRIVISIIRREGLAEELQIAGGEALAGATEDLASQPLNLVLHFAYFSQ